MSNNSQLESEYLYRRDLMLQLVEACEKAHPASSCLLQGIILQLDWQWQTGRWNPTQTGGSDWWLLANYTLTAWVAEAALEAGIIQNDLQSDVHTRPLPMPRQVANAWKAYFSSVTRSQENETSEMDQTQLTALYWKAHDICLDEISARFSKELDQLPPRERTFASAWVSLVRVLAKVKFNPGIKIVKRLQKLLPTVILDENGWATAGVLCRLFVRTLAGGHRMLGLLQAV